MRKSRKKVSHLHTPAMKRKAQAARALAVREKALQKSRRSKTVQRSDMRGPDSRHLKGLSAIDDQGAVLHGAQQKLSDAFMERSDQPYGGLTPDIALLWEAWTPEQRACYNVGYSTASDRASKSRSEEDERRELRYLREFRRTVLAIIERNPYE